MLAAVGGQSFDAGEHQLGDLQACTACEVLGAQSTAFTDWISMDHT